MTEAEWLAAYDPQRMLDDLPGVVRRGRLLLVVVAFCRRLGADLRRASAVELLDTAEAFARGGCTVAAFREALITAEDDHSVGDNRWKGRNHPDRGGLTAIELVRAFAGRAPDADALGLPPRSRQAVHDALRDIQIQLGHVHQEGRALDSYDHARRREHQYQVRVIRDVIGNPFRPVVTDPAWGTSTVLDLARRMDETREFSRMPILADALEEAGCDNADVLSHCRGDGPHVRGCWVVDLILGNS